MTESDEVLAIPLWINGHAYLTMAPVSYTHLDVYKRQGPACASHSRLST